MSTPTIETRGTGAPTSPPQPAGPPGVRPSRRDEPAERISRALGGAVRTADADVVARTAAAQLGYAGSPPALRSLLEDMAASAPAALSAPTPDRVWLLRRGDGSLVAPIRFGATGLVEGSPHPNEARWSIGEGGLVLTDVDGVVTTRFVVAATSRGHALLAGPFQRGEVVHVLSPADCAYARVRTTPPERVPELVEGAGLVDLVADAELPPTPVVILGTPRTGSHLLVNLLNSSREVFFDAELLDYDRISVFGGTVPVRGALGALRANHPREFVTTMLSRSFHEDGRSLRDVAVRGFKLFPGQSQDVWDWVIDSPRFEIVHLWRRNLLAEYSSLEAAWRSGHWVDVRLDPAQLRLDFDERRFRRFVEEKQGFTARLRARLAARPAGFAEIEYSELDDEHVGRLIARLAGRPVAGPLSDLGLQKQLPGATLQRYADTDAVVRCLDDLGHPEWGESDAP